MGLPQIFISHSHDDKEIALAWKKLIQQISMGQISTWLSSDGSPEGGMPPGKEWAEVIYERLQNATHVLAIFTPHSLQRHWIWWECGVARGLRQERKLIPVFHSMKIERLPQPISAYQAFAGDDMESVTQLCVRLIAETNLKPSPQHWGSVLEEFRKDIIPPTHLESTVLVDLSHGQQDWNWDRRIAPSILEVEHLKAIARHENQSIKVEAINEPEKFNGRSLRQVSGLIFAMPLKRRLGSIARDAIIEWVRRGGHLLMLGYELGDRHHSGNLNELAYYFGLHFEGNIVAPSSWDGSDKPYGKPVTFPVTPGAHTVLSSIDGLALKNVQTIRGEPGTVQILGLGTNLIGRIANLPEEVKYTDGSWQLFPSEKMKFVPHDGADAVLVQAPRGLTQEGVVLALGSWKLAEGSNEKMFQYNLIRWLAHHV